MSSDRRPNRLASEKSPYLLQHARNPVDWYPWGDEAFAKARAEHKPIFLSIGYSTCHWCHVMERESFENDDVAALLNEHYVPVKVDREERPDVDRVYMTAMQAMGMGGGWPLTVFLTPELEPFFGGTYFAPRATHGRPGMLELLPRVHEAWQRDRERITESGARVFQALATLDEPPPGETLPPAPRPEALIEDCARTLEQLFDAEHGGFGEAPKFPQAVNLTFLFRHYARDPVNRRRSLDLALRQLDAMRAGGIHDQLGGGFHRYATDRAWLVPHFEKMLYDQAQLAWAYLEGFQAAGRPEDADTARRILGYVARDLTSPEGGFYSAEDADSEGVEGKFYVWTPAELDSELGAELAAPAAFHWGVTPAGNFEGGASILHEAHPIPETAARCNRTEAEARDAIERARERLLEARGRRPRPHRDDKVLAAWNGLMISAFARGARVLGEPEWAERAERAAEFVWSRLWNDAARRMHRRWREGEAALEGQLDDYAFVALGFLDLYRARLDPTWLERAVHLTNAQLERFWDDKRGGFFESPAGDPHLRVRMKDDFDGAEIAGNSIAAENLSTLGELLDLDKWRDHARRLLEFYSRKLARSPLAMPHMLAVLQAQELPPRHIVLVGGRDTPGIRQMLHEFDRRYLPNDVLLLAEPGETGRRLAVLVPFVANLAAQPGRGVAYVCINASCRLPTIDPAVLGEQLDARGTTATPGAPA